MTEAALLPTTTDISETASPTITYLGSSRPGSATSAAAWRISRITFDGSGNYTGQKWADGNGNYDNIWDNRASLTYL